MVTDKLLILHLKYAPAVSTLPPIYSQASVVFHTLPFFNNFYDLFSTAIIVIYVCVDHCGK